MDTDTNEQLIAFCQEALRIPSYSGQEQGVAELMKRKMEEYGFDEVIIDRFGSVLGTINGKRPGKTVLMDGHIDTVDVIDAPQWEHDPFGGEIADGKIYGRGASDMKGSDCAMITAAARFAEKTGRDFAGRVCVSCTVHEERFEGVVGSAGVVGCASAAAWSYRKSSSSNGSLQTPRKNTRCVIRNTEAWLR